MNTFDIENLGQVFTPPHIVSEMLMLRKNYGSCLEPSAGNGSFFNQISKCVGIEIDPKHCQQGMLNIDFFDYDVSNKFDTIIGNPPYVQHKYINEITRQKLDYSLFDERSNLYLFFIEKCIKHLNDSGELIFITPRDFLKSTSSMKLNQFLYSQGTITDLIDLGDSRIFNQAQPNCVIFRFEKGNFSRKTNISKQFVCNNGQLYFTDNQYSVLLSDIFSVKVGGVSGKDQIFKNEQHGNQDFVTSITCKTGKTQKMVFVEQPTEYLKTHREILIKRKIRSFNEQNWWQWGRKHHISDRKRIYVNTKTRNKQPFFLHECNHYDGSVLALFPHNQDVDLIELTKQLNAVNWFELGFVCDGRFLFSQKSLENTMLPSSFFSYCHRVSEVQPTLENFSVENDNFL